MILGFKNINDTLLKGVKQSHKTDLKLLVELTCVDHANSTSYHEGKTVYICSAEPPGDMSLDCTILILVLENFLQLKNRARVCFFMALINHKKFSPLVARKYLVYDFGV